MKTKSIILIAISLGFGLVAAIGMTQVMGRQKAETKQVEKEIDVLVAKRDLEIHELITAEDVVNKRFRPSQVPEGVATSIEHITDMKATGRVARGNFIDRSQLIQKNKVITIDIPKGYSVYSVRPSIESTFQNSLRPGDRIDIIGIVRKGKSQVAKTFLKNIRVFGINDQLTRQVSEDKISIKLVQVLLRPRQAEMLALVQSVGKIQFVMRPDDHTLVELDEEEFAADDEEGGNVSLDFFFNSGSGDEDSAKALAQQPAAMPSWDMMDAPIEEDKDKPHHVVFMTAEGPVEYVYETRQSQPVKVDGNRRESKSMPAPMPFGMPANGAYPPPHTYPPSGELREGAPSKPTAGVNRDGQRTESGSSESSSGIEEAESE